MGDAYVPDPVELFLADARRASTAGDPMAHRCYLATLTETDQPALRTLVLRGVDSDRIEVLFSNTSPKWRHLRANGRYELLVYWPSIQCQYRIRGGFEEIPFAELASSWKHKSFDGKLLDLYYAKAQPQGSRIENVGAFVEAIASIRNQANDLSAVQAPTTITGIRLKPKRVERLDLTPSATIYTRHLYIRINGGWQRDLLVP